MNRRIFVLIIVVVLILFGISGALYYLTNKQQEAPNIQISLQIKKVLDERVISPVGAYDNNSIWYFNSDSRLFKANTDGSNLSEYPLPSISKNGLRQVLWPKSGADFITISNGTVASKDYYNSTSKVFIHLANNIQWLDWLPDGKRIVYIWQSDDKKTQQLAMSDADGTGYKSIASVFWPDLAVKVSPDGKQALMYRTNIVGDTNKIYGVNLETGAISTLVNQGKNNGAVWISASKFLFSKDPKIYVYDMAKKEVVDLNLSTTLDRVAVTSDGKSLYAAVAKGPAADSFLKVDLTNYDPQTYFEPGTSVDVKNIILVGNSVYYISNADGKLYMIGS